MVWSEQRACVFTVRDSQQPRCSELLLAVMVAAGGERRRQTWVRYLQESLKHRSGMRATT